MSRSYLSSRKNSREPIPGAKTDQSRNRGRSGYILAGNLFYVETFTHLPPQFFDRTLQAPAFIGRAHLQRFRRQAAQI
jgi:hypothetical protein